LVGLVNGKEPDGSSGSRGRNRGAVERRAKLRTRATEFRKPQNSGSSVSVQLNLPPSLLISNRHLALPALLFLVMLATLALVNRRRIQPRPARLRLAAATLFVLLLVALTIPGCGGSGAAVTHNPGTPAGTYSLTVTGTVTSGSATLIHSFTLKVTVQ